MRTWPGGGSRSGFVVSSSCPGATAWTARYVAVSLVMNLSCFRSGLAHSQSRLLDDEGRSDEAIVGKVDADRHEVRHGLAVRTGDVDAALGRELDAIDRDISAQVMRGGRVARNLDRIVVPLQQAIIAGIDGLDLRVGGDLVGECQAERAPRFLILMPDRQLLDLHTLMQRQER